MLSEQLKIKIELEAEEKFPPKSKVTKFIKEYSGINPMEQAYTAGATKYALLAQMLANTLEREGCKYDWCRTHATCAQCEALANYHREVGC